MEKGQEAVRRVALRREAAVLLERHWLSEGFTTPHPVVYPWRWLWDSCFCALVRLELGDERALTELESVFRWQHPDGFVPHVGYHADPVHDGFWGQSGSSTLTQPPMYGHVVAEMRRRGMDVPARLVEAAEAGIGWILRNRRRDAGRVVIVHPWESGCDDSPRWDAWCPERLWSHEAWWRVKGDLVRTLARDRHGAAVGNPSFEVASAGFNALVAFNAGEIGIAHDIPAPPPEPPLTVDDLLVGLGWPAPATAGPALDAALDDGVFGGPYGPAGVRRDHPAFDGDRYWRGAAWPQMAYLLWVAARRAGRDSDARDLATRALAGAAMSGWAEHWNPDTGRGGGARPHSWSTVVVLMAGDADLPAQGATDVQSRMPLGS